MDQFSTALGTPSATVPEVQERDRFPLLTPLRGVAALTVLAHHIFLVGFRQPPTRPLSFGERLFDSQALSVPLFFLLSGFLLFSQFARAAHTGRTIDRWSFWRRRLLRILPGFYVAFAILAIWPGLQQPDAKILPVDLLLLQTWAPGYAKSGIGPTWTLSAEVGFYVLLPFIALAVNSRIARRPVTPRRILTVQLAGIAALWAASVLFHLLLTTIREPTVVKFGYLTDALPAVFHWFAVGMALAAVHAYRQAEGLTARRDLTWLWWGAAAVLMVLTAIIFTDPQTHTELVPRIVAGLTAVCVFAPIVERHEQPPAVERFLVRIPGLGWIGLISYGLFLWHLPMIRQINDAILTERDLAHKLVFVAAAAAVSITLGALSYYLVERPFLSLKGRRVQRPAAHEKMSRA